jgi:pimeloyl-ACP methyl ester carboxylesterase
MVAEWHQDGVSHHYALCGGTGLHYVEKGSGPLVVLLHGIPESWRAWRRFIPPLADAGHSVAAGDLRGYGLSDKPRSVSMYRGELLAEDVAAIIRSCGRERASVVGHSWGALAAWLFAMRHPEMLDRLVIMNVPHPLVWVAAMRTLRYWRRNWQMLLFQPPVLPEWALRARDFAALRQGFERDLGGVGAVDREEHVAAMAQPEGLTGALNYYRAFLRENPLRPRWAPSVIDGPVLVVWGANDRFFPADLALPPRRWVPDARVEMVADAGHWTHHDQPEKVNDLLLEFLDEA